MLSNLADKMQRLDYSEVLDTEKLHLNSIKKFRQFDHQITTPLHGYTSADDYYGKCSAIGFMQGRSWRPSIWFHQRIVSFLEQLNA